MTQTTAQTTAQAEDRLVRAYAEPAGRLPDRTPFERMATVLGFIAKHPGFRARFDDADPGVVVITDPGGESEAVPADLASVRAWMGY